MTIPPIAALPPSPPTPAAGSPAAASPSPGFSEAIQRGLEQVSGLEHRADALIEDLASGGPTALHDVMIATTEASLAVDMMVHVRDRALEAYHEIMRMQL